MDEKKLLHNIKLLFDEGIKAVQPSTLINQAIKLDGNLLEITDVNQNIKQINLDDFEKIFVIGAGKASASMAEELEKIFAKSNYKIECGIIVAPYNTKNNLKVIEIIEASHPLPDKNGVEGAEKIIQLCSDATENDLVLNLLSGGASSLLPAPVSEITLSEKIEITKLLLNKGAAIEELNLIRKHLSKIKGGKLLNYIYPAKVVSLIISDVIGDRIDIIGSGITSHQENNYEGFKKIIKQYKLQNTIPASLLHKIDQQENQFDNNSGNVANATNLIVGNNSIALRKIASVASELGYLVKIMDEKLSGEAREVGDKIAKEIIELKQNSKNNLHCLLYGGETWVNVKGNGKGGRNQELALSVAIKIDGIDGVQFLSGGTDGIDGPTNAAGAFCTGNTIAKAKNANIDFMEYLNNNDSYNFFKKINQLVMTGPTGTNVADIQIVLSHM
ncbi:MAG: glycerate kinase [Melioribacteraceae bacterium]|nr:glycerate kinase [Melioribacteraceae bacterium]